MTQRIGGILVMGTNLMKALAFLRKAAWAGADSGGNVLEVLRR